MGKLICAGLGPGDPDLMSVKAHRAVTSSKHIAFFRKKNRHGMARRIVDGLLRDDAVEYAMEYPVTTEIPLSDPGYNASLAPFYDDWAARLLKLSQDEPGEDIVVLCEGDPFFYGSFMHLYTRLRDKMEIDVIPAITGMSGCWTQTGEPITWGDDVMTVLMGTLSEDDLAQRMSDSDAIVVMKTGQNIPKIRKALQRAGKYDDAWIVKRGTMPDQEMSKLSELDCDENPYFAIILVHGQGRRP
ncbi:precorrin-2 C(20)-methyltransferase [Thalassobius sp. I31.1]|uniref:precorrin-2 C(20)-methyltransferase n=1 Tax=Thalassobius sp. I31.1 TaxID=2109912 RepID=UPI000D1BD2FE|nr:precorrin-2 C(20)-methyltransferase [Thalassobius sp. I31.1]